MTVVAAEVQIHSSMVLTPLLRYKITPWLWVVASIQLHVTGCHMVCSNSAKPTSELGKELLLAVEVLIKGTVWL